MPSVQGRKRQRTGFEHRLRSSLEPMSPLSGLCISRDSLGDVEQLGELGASALGREVLRQFVRLDERLAALGELPLREWHLGSAPCLKRRGVVARNGCRRARRDGRRRRELQDMLALLPGLERTRRHEARVGYGELPRHHRRILQRPRYSGRSALLWRLQEAISASHTPMASSAMAETSGTRGAVERAAAIASSCGWHSQR